MIIITNLCHNIQSHCQFIKICHMRRIHTIQVQRIHHQIIIIKLYIILKHQHIMHSTIAIPKSMWVPQCTHYQEILPKVLIIKPQGLDREIHTQQYTKKMVEKSIALTTQLLGRHNMLQILPKILIIKPQGIYREIHTQQHTKKMIEVNIVLTTQLLGRHNMLQILTHLTRQNQSLQEQNMYRGSNSNS